MGSCHRDGTFDSMRAPLDLHKPLTHHVSIRSGRDQCQIEITLRVRHVKRILVPARLLDFPPFCHILNP
jgi:hypothetical protein